MKQKVTMTIDPKVVENVDNWRGLIPRSAFVEKILRGYLNEKESQKEA